MILYTHGLKRFTATYCHVLDFNQINLVLYTPEVSYLPYFSLLWSVSILTRQDTELIYMPESLYLNVFIFTERRYLIFLWINFFKSLNNIAINISQNKIVIAHMCILNFLTLYKHSLYLDNSCCRSIYIPADTHIDNDHKHLRIEFQCIANRINTSGRR